MIKFGTGGWRAVIADEFTKENIRLLMAGLCRLMEKEGLAGAEVCVGYDRRFLSKESAHWAAEVLAGCGFHPFVINRSSPTPLMMFTVKKRGEPYGIAVTASHNPAIYNGIKVFTAGGRDADETVTARIEAEIAQLTPADVKSVDYDEAVARGLITEANPMNEYLDSILSAVDVEAIKNAALRIGFDPMYGVSWSSLSMLLTTCRCDLEIIHDRHDTLFGGKLPAPNVDTLKPLAALVLDKHCDLGIATDGDADRLGVIDNEGQFIHPNKLLVLLYYYLVKYRGWHGPCVRNNSTSHLLDRVAAGLGEKCYEVPVGFKWISAKIDEVDAVLGGESSGGLTVRGHIHGKDSAYAAALFVEMVSAMNASPAQIMADLTARFGAFEMADSDFSYPAEQKPQLTHLLFEQKALPAFDRPVRRVSYEDGCKVYFEDGGFVVCRFSGTEPLLRFCAEADTKEKALASIQAFKDMLKL